MNRLRLAAVLLLLSSAQVSAGDLVRQDFAYGIELETEAGAAIHSLVIPDEVYLAVSRYDLGDLRVLNADDEELPHAVRLPAGDDIDGGKRAAVPFFPLTGMAEAPGRDDLAVTVRRGADDLIVGIASGTPEKGEGLAAYLLDLGKGHAAVAALELRWKNAGLPITDVSLLESDDLVLWRPVVESAILADLEYGGHRVVARGITLPAPVRRYLKLVGKGQGRLPDLAGIEAVAEAPATEAGRSWAPLRRGRIGREDDRSFVDYQEEYHLLADRARLRFTEANSMLRASVQSRPDSRSPWTTRCSEVFYTLQAEGAAIARDVCAFPPTADRLWRLQIFEDGVGVDKTGRVPSLELGWRAAELLFVARGKAPYTLVFGSGKAGGSGMGGESQMLLETVADSEQKMMRQAKAGKRFELGGEKALQPLPPPLPWQRWLLWAVLGAGVALLAAMVRRLWLEMRRP